MPTYVHTFTSIEPPARVDGFPWTNLRVEESTLETGPFTAVQTVAISPVDVDPTNPRPRDVTIELATLESGYFRVVFLDAAGDQSTSSAPMRSPATLGPAGVTVAGLKLYLDKTASGDDELLQLILDSAVALIGWYTGRDLRPDPVSDTAAVITRTVYSPLPFVRLPDAREVTAVSINGTVITPPAYRLVGTPSTGLIVDGDTVATLERQALTGSFTTRPPSTMKIDVTGRFGFSTMPVSLRDAIYTLAARRYRERDANYADQTITPDGMAVSYFRQLPPAVKMTLESFIVQADRLGV